MKALINVMIVLFAFLLTACASPEVESYQSEWTEAIDDSEIQSETVITIWTPDDVVNQSIDRFKERYPAHEFVVTEIEEHELVEHYHEAILTDQAPDLFIIPEAKAGEFAGIDGLFDLNEEPFFNQAFLDRRPDELIDRYINDDGEMYASPIHFFPYVSYYRADLFEEAGLPSEPEDVANLIQSEEGWIKLVETMREEGRYVFESTQSLLDSALSITNAFDETYQYVYNTDPFQKLLNRLMWIQAEGMNPNVSVWNENGQQALSDDKLVMFQLPTYGHDHLARWVPEQEGKWRITDFPLGIQGFDRDTALIGAIPEASRNKTIASEMLQLIADDLFSMHTHQYTHPFLDQDGINRLSQRLLDSDMNGKPTILDSIARLHWENTIYRITSGHTMDETMVQGVHNQLLDTVRNHQRILINR
ncbi:carbohydrate ABC transporter substrate-binding protein, CUT1 family [Pelagirhabdus alkalitolerans]|uniref:Carbohydrate ABC transporter substrate-binding protein, CUT1 family n=1 Tax=Pelagirhabdus alkalitolerans TaxID=1612202 RepID=A0A1G6L0A7_9BACI|nr:ABC transporter substrate-binding protein [Pelagirhabdus alkalitolerans]SDC36633.1 carbohydrate ABC transporter substrate-binding protein, CUT1 family [Pelagirhabdus alkalitolerans]